MPAADRVPGQAVRRPLCREAGRARPGHARDTLRRRDSSSPDDELNAAGT
jgi:hypothetical protein